MIFSLRKYVGVLLVVSVAMAQYAHAFNLGLAKEDAGQAGAMFDFATSARALAMGHAQTAVADDASTALFNAAGLARLERKDVMTQYSVLQENTGFGTFSFAQPTVDYGTFGFSLLSLRSGQYDKRETGLSIGSFTQAESAFMFSYGMFVKEKMALGSSIKVVRQEIDTYSATGYGADLSALMPLSARVTVGASLANVIQPSLKLKSETDRYPRQLRGGLRFDSSERWTFAADLSKTDKRSAKFNIGAEWRATSMLSLRAGLNETEVTGGLGFKIGDFDIDYALAFNDPAKGVENLGQSHRFGIHWAFGQNVTEQKNNAKWQKKAAVLLDLLTQKMNEPAKPVPADNVKLVEATEKVIRHQGYAKPQHLYAAQGYAYYLSGDCVKSVTSLSEAVELDPFNNSLRKHLNKVKQECKQEQIDAQLKMVKTLFEKGDYKKVVSGCESVLIVDDKNAEALAYLDDAKKRLKEPIDREMRIGRAKMAQEDYLDAIRHLQKAKEMDPENKEAQKLMDSAIVILEKKSATMQVAQNKPTPKGAPAVTFVNVGKSRSLYSEGLALYAKGKFKEAASTWELAVSTDPDNTLARTAYNRVLTELKEVQSR